MLSDIALAVTEATTNVVLHAYRDREEPGTVTIKAERNDDHVCIYVLDEGTGLAPRVDSPGLGLGLGLIAQVADSADVRAPETRRHRGRHALQRRCAMPPRALPAMQLVRSGAAGSAALELAVSHALLTRVAARRAAADAARLPARPAVAFGKLDTLRPGYPAAVAAARAHGYEPVLRLPGGHAAAYHARRWRSTSCGRSTTRARHPRPVPHEGERLAGALRDARRRRPRGGGARRVLPGRLQRQRARAREADRHRAAARPRRRAARRLDRRRRRPGRARRARRRLRGARIRVGRATAGAVDEEVAGVTLDAVEGAVDRRLRRARAGHAGRDDARARPPPRAPAPLASPA